MLIASRSFTVSENSRDVATGLIIQSNDRVIIRASGTIWAGVWFTGENDANGWPDHRANNNSPLPGAPPFGLLAKIGPASPFFYAGRSFDRTFSGAGGELFLRINDDVPANGSGAFSVTVEQHRSIVTPVSNVNVVVRESDRDVDTGIQVQTNDRIVITASGHIWAGVWFTGENGPDGWPGHTQTNRNAPLQGVPPYSLLARVGTTGFFFAGRFADRTHSGAPGRLFLRINDDVPGNGNGLFNCNIQVFRSAPPARIGFTGTGSLTIDNTDARIRGPHTGSVSGELEFSGDRTQVNITRFDPIVVRFDTPLGPDTATLTLTNNPTGSFQASTGGMQFNGTTLRITHSISIAGTSNIALVPLTTGPARLGIFNLNGEPLNRINRTMRLVAASVMRGGLLVDGNNCSIDLSVTLNSLP